MAAGILSFPARSWEQESTATLNGLWPPGTVFSGEDFNPHWSKGLTPVLPEPATTKKEA